MVMRLLATQQMIEPMVKMEREAKVTERRPKMSAKAAMMGWTTALARR
jgi:hypothetical protein